MKKVCPILWRNMKIPLFRIKYLIMLFGLFPERYDEFYCIMIIAGRKKIRAVSK